MNLAKPYLDFLKYSGSTAPTLATLRSLHLLHTLKFPFENITPFLHLPVELKPETVLNKLTIQNRGGYCFEQNLLFSEVLKELGFKVKGLGGRVVWNQPEELITRRSHMLLLVDIEGQDYLADVGFGGLTLTTPLEFKVDVEQSTTHEKFRIGTIGGDYKLQAFVGSDWKALYRFDLQEQMPIDYEVANFYVSTHPSSIFRNLLIAGKPLEKGRVSLNNNVFTHYSHEGKAEKKVLSNVSQVKDVLTNTFNIQLPMGIELDKRIQSVLDESLQRS
jgi:N-hydroxyarylamine O-acetyltransferase